MGCNNQKECYAAINIIFVTVYAEYATEAFSIYASGYLMKPLHKEAVEKAIENLRFPIAASKKLLPIWWIGTVPESIPGSFVQCRGSIYQQPKPVCHRSG
ncbi:MAG: hypothetical protein EGS40_01830 [Agathobacter sp.]|nr:hypothetical protein [Agathobacter sp.]MBD9285985.1 hypothetical protein [Agathobacter sp.]